MIETRLLQYFLAVAKNQNITRAAEQLHITQPTLSQQMISLEKQLGKPLFIREKKSMTLTPEGLLFRIRAEEILDLLEQTERTVRSGENPDADIIRIGCCEISMPPFAVRALEQMQRIYPQVQLHIYSENSTSELLEKNTLDMAFLFSNVRVANYDHYQLPFRSRWGILVPDSSPLARKPSLSTKEVKSLPLIFPYKVFHNKHQPSYFPFELGELHICAVCNHFEEAHRLTARGMGYAYTLEHAFDPQLYPHLVFRPIDPNIVTPFYLITKKKQYLTPAPQSFHQLLLEELAKEAEFS